MTAASPGTLGEVSGHAFSTRASLPPQVEALVDVIQDPIGQIEFLRKLIPPGFTSECSSTPMTSPEWSGAEARAGVRPEHHEAVRLTAVPKGVPAAEMSAAQREQLRALLQVFVGRIPDELAEREAAKFAGDKLRDVYFAWAGGTSAGNRTTTVCRSHGIPRAASNRARPAARPGRTYPLVLAASADVEDLTGCQAPGRGVPQFPG